MKKFVVADFNVKGEVERKEDYSYSALEQICGAPELITAFAAAIWRNSAFFEVGLGPPESALQVRWMATANSAGIMTLREGSCLMSLSFMAAGQNPDADSITLNAFQSHLLRELHDTGVEPAFDLLSIPARPLVATINFRSPQSPDDQRLVALCDRCFGAAYFRYLSLA